MPKDLFEIKQFETGNVYNADDRDIPDDAAVYSSLRSVTNEILEGLTPREAKVLRMRFGIEMNTDHTLEEVGQQFSVTKDRISQIESKALRKLKCHAGKLLQQYVQAA